MFNETTDMSHKSQTSLFSIVFNNLVKGNSIEFIKIDIKRQVYSEIDNVEILNPNYLININEKLL